VLADRNALVPLLREGRGQMPPVGRDWTPHQISALVAYTKRFANKGGSSNAGAGG